MADSQIDPNSILKNIYCSKLILLQGLYCSGWNILLAVVIWYLIHIITLLPRRINEVTYLSII